MPEFPHCRRGQGCSCARAGGERFKACAAQNCAADCLTRRENSCRIEPRTLAEAYTHKDRLRQSGQQPGRSRLPPVFVSHAGTAKPSARRPDIEIRPADRRRGGLVGLALQIAQTPHLPPATAGRASAKERCRLGIVAGTTAPPLPAAGSTAAAVRDRLRAPRSHRRFLHSRRDRSKEPPSAGRAAISSRTAKTFSGQWFQIVCKVATVRPNPARAATSPEGAPAQQPSILTSRKAAAVSAGGITVWTTSRSGSMPTGRQPISEQQVARRQRVHNRETGFSVRLRNNARRRRTRPAAQ